ncbi:MAG: NAD-dependent protein deacetylase [Gammaproteobacteria bacterium]|nr:NAD-dependent protein deacetylase [Gammaproteobacteria bacterium]
MEALTEAIQASQRLLVLTGAGVSTLSGIPEYRDDDGEWKHSRPVLYQDFMGSNAVRKRYWARSMIGWNYFSRALPNRAHRALAMLEQSGRVDLLVTQNVDGLHQRAGSQNVIDLHGRLDVVVCQQCGASRDRASLQARLEADNPGFRATPSVVRPDGDVDLERDFTDFVVPACEHCRGIVKPDVVFYGESVPRDRVSATEEALQRCDALLVVGSSLMVRSGLRFVHRAADRGIPTLLVNRGRTRADELFSVKVPDCCGTVLDTVNQRLATA